MLKKIALAALFTLSPLTHADLIEIGSAGIDGVAVKWLNDPTREVSIRTAVQIEPFKVSGLGKINLFAGDASILPLEVTASKDPATGEVQLTRFKTALLRANAVQTLPVEVLSLYRDLDRGITTGFDIVNARIPISITKNGEVTIYPGVDLGFRKYTGHESFSAQASATIEAKANKSLVEGWLETGILGRLRLEAITQGMSGSEEMIMGYLSMCLRENQTLYARVYTGVEHDSNRDSLNLPAANWFSGLGLFGILNQ